MPEDVNLSDYDYILNVPTRAASIDKRGFDALGDIAQAFSRETNLPLEWGILEDIAEPSQKTDSPVQNVNSDHRSSYLILKRSGAHGYSDSMMFAQVAVLPKPLSGRLAEAEPEAIDFLTIANRPWTEGNAQWKQLREEPTIYESWVKTDRERQQRLAFEASAGPTPRRTHGIRRRPKQPRSPESQAANNLRFKREFQFISVSPAQRIGKTTYRDRQSVTIFRPVDEGLQTR